MSAGYCRCVMFLYHDAQMHLPRCICLQFARTPVAPGCCCNHLEILGSTAGGWCVTGFDFISNLVFICSTAQCCTNADSTNQRKSLAESLKLLERYVLFSWSVPGWRCVCVGGVGGGGEGACHLMLWILIDNDSASHQFPANLCTHTCSKKKNIHTYKFLASVIEAACNQGITTADDHLSTAVGKLDLDR